MVPSKLNKPYNASMASKIFFLFVLISFLTSATTQLEDINAFTAYYCNPNTNATGAFQLNLRTLMSSLLANATSDTQFYNITINGKKPSDSVYGAFMCRGDTLSQLCQQCVQNATQTLFSYCSTSEEGLIWYDMCMVRFSNRLFLSTMDTTHIFGFYKYPIASNSKNFMRLLFLTMNQSANEAAHPLIGEKKYATREANISKFETLYCLTQCTPDLSPRDCKTCLSLAIGNITRMGEGKIGGQVLYASCNIRFEMYPFYLPPTPTPPPVILVSETNSSHVDSKFSEDPMYLSHSCSNNKIITSNNTFQIDLMALLSYLSSNATNGKKFHMVNVTERVYGLFMCRGDLPSRLCQQCVLNATSQISSRCRSLQEAIIWYSHCTLRYSYRNFFYAADKSPIYSKLNITNNSGPNQEEKFLTFALSNTLTKVIGEATNSDEKYASKSLKLNNLQTLYTLAQCTKDLSDVNCVSCFEEIIATTIPWSRLGSVGGRVSYPSCNLRFELFQFYRDGDEAQPVGPSRPTGNKKGLKHAIILIVVPTFVSIILFSCVFYLLKRAKGKRHATILKENFGHESAVLEPWQFSLATVKAATKKFSDQNKIGQGGFGEVYKGILFDGQQIAVKKLLRSSKQGTNEFKNEILLIAKLQHRNLVTFIGFCLEEQEQILIYEYVPNKSLDYFLFDSQQKKVLRWFERYIIIEGIAKGILYLHEYSRLKVIHRDLKPSNVLLDENMIPKISDFGLGKILELNEDEGSTNRIVGTYGYMSPEYAMFGHFSEKSDIFSFGVMVLEIISGRKNQNSYESHRIVDNLLSYVWRQWRNETPLSIIDSDIETNYSEIEVRKCIQIGLLCVQQNPDDRPTIATVISYLSTHSIELPSPQEPAFFIRDRMIAKTNSQESSSTQSINSSIAFSTNEMSISKFLPR